MPEEEAARTSRRRRSQAAEDAEDEAFILAHAGETQLTQEEIDGIDEDRRHDPHDDPEKPVPDSIN
jgi:hypothetical protein